MDAREEPRRKCILRAYGAVSLLQVCLGILLVISVMVALHYNEDPFILSSPPYFAGALFVGIMILCAGVCSLYVFVTEAPLLDYYYLEIPDAMRIRRAVRGNTISSVFTILGCLGGLFMCAAFALGPCHRRDWLFQCSFQTNKHEHRAIAIFISVFLFSCLLLSIYSSIMACVHGWVFDFEACIVTMRPKKDEDEEENHARPVSGFQPVAMFDVEDQYNSNDEMQVSNKYNATSSFRHSGEERPWSGYSDDSIEGNHHAAMKQHIQATQPQCYIAVLNDPAMKQKLKERNTRLQNQEI